MLKRLAESPRDVETLSVTVSILTDIRPILGAEAGQLQRVVGESVGWVAEEFQSGAWRQWGSVERAVKEDALMLLLRGGDAAAERVVDTLLGDEEEFREMKAYRAAKREGNVEARVKEAFGSQETSVLAAMSAVEEDAFLADLVRLLAEDAHTLLTQNVMYLFKYFNSNISTLTVQTTLHSTLPWDR